MVDSEEKIVSLEKEGAERDEPSATTNEIPNFGWSTYAERINGRFEMIGFLAILLIELLTKESSFLHWTGLLS